MYRRREFLAGVAALPLVGTSIAGPFRRGRFARALEIVVNEKVRAGELVVPAGALNRRVRYRGRVATAGNHVYDETKPPWYVTTFKALVQWVRENWDVILKILVTVLPLIILEPQRCPKSVSNSNRSTASLTSTSTAKRSATDTTETEDTSSSRSTATSTRSRSNRPTLG